MFVKYKNSRYCISVFNVFFLTDCSSSFMAKREGRTPPDAVENRPEKWPCEKVFGLPQADFGPARFVSDSRTGVDRTSLTSFHE